MKIIDESAVRASARREWASNQAVRDEFLKLENFEAFSVANARGLAKAVHGQVKTTTMRNK